MGTLEQFLDQYYYEAYAQAIKDLNQEAKSFDEWLNS
jgi:vacuolar-type H+-ATPase subunit C/Vma6